MDLVSSHRLEQLDQRPVLLQSDVRTIEVESTRQGSKLDKDHGNFFCTFHDEVQLIKQADEALMRGKEIIHMMYTYRSVAQTIPEISLADYATEELTIEEKSELAAKTAEINQKLIEILRPEIGKIASLLTYVVHTISLFHSFVVHGCKKKDALPEIFRLYLLDLVEMLTKVPTIFVVESY